MRRPRGYTLYTVLILISAGRRKAVTRLRSKQFYQELVAPTQIWDPNTIQLLKGLVFY